MIKSIVRVSGLMALLLGFNLPAFAVTSSSFGEPEKRRELRSRLEPSLYFDLDFGNGIVNLTPDATPNRDGGPDTLTIDNFRDGFQKVSYLDLEIGLSGAIRFLYNQTAGISENLWALAGILPVKGKQVWSLQYAKTLDAAKGLKGIRKIPETVAEFRTWSTGNAMAYQSKGGMLYVATLGWSIFSAQLGRVAVGVWEVYLEKINRTTIYAKVSNSKIESLYGSVGVPFVQLSKSKFGSRDDAFSFTYSLDSEEAVKALFDFINGNSLPSEELAHRDLSREQPVVKRIDDFKGKTVGKTTSARVGIPLLANVSKTKTKADADEMTIGHIENKTIRANYSIIDKTFRSKILKVHKQNRKIFFGADYRIINRDTAEVEKGQMGRMSWKFEDEKMSTSNLRQIISDLYISTGIERVNVKVPGNGKLAYATVNFDVKIGPDLTLNLLEHYRRTTENEWLAHFRKSVDSQFDRDQNVICEISDTVQCEREFKWKTNSAAKKMWKAMQAMAENHETDAKLFSQAFAKWGSQLMTNRYTFQQGLIAVGSGTKIDFSVEGTRVSNYQLRLESRIDRSRGENELSFEVMDPHAYDHALDPRLRRSRFHGVVQNMRDAGEQVIVEP